MNDKMFWESMGNVRKHRYIKLVTTKNEGVTWFQNQIIIQQTGFQNMCQQNI